MTITPTKKPRSTATIERNRLMQEGRNAARAERARLAKAETERAARKAEVPSSFVPAVTLCREAHANADRQARHAAAMADAKAAYARALDQQSLARQGGRPRTLNRLKLSADPADALLRALAGQRS